MPDCKHKKVFGGERVSTVPWFYSWICDICGYEDKVYFGYRRIKDTIENEKYEETRIRYNKVDLI